MIRLGFNSCETDELVQAKSEMVDTSLLKVENDKIRSENVGIKEALKNVICLTCGTTPSVQADCHEKQRLRNENAQLKEEVYPNIIHQSNHLKPH